MSQTRQTAKLHPVAPGHSAIATLSRDYPAGHVIPLHFHDRDQVVYASRGVMTVRAVDSAWVVPTDRAVWIPATLPHSITMSGTVSMRTLYLRPRLARSLPRSCCVVNVSALLKELILHACTLATLHRKNERQRHLIDLMRGPFGNYSDGVFAACQSLGPSRASSRWSVTDRPRRSTHPRADLQRDRCRQTHDRAALPGGNRHDLRQMAPSSFG